MQVVLHVVISLTLSGIIHGVGASNRTMRSLVSEDTSMKAAKPSWTLSYKMVPCILNPDLSQLGPFSKGLNKQWAKSDHKLVETGAKLAKELNCKLCDIDVQGSILPSGAQDAGAAWREADVKCAVTIQNMQDACFLENGNLGNWDGSHLSPRGKCAPCPVECDKGCQMPGTTDALYLSSTWFKCKTTTPKKFMNTKHFTMPANAQSLFPQKGKLFTTPSKYECEQTTVEKLEKKAREAFGGDGPAEGELMVPSFSKRSNFAKTGEFKLWCKYKDDYVPDTETVGEGRWQSEKISPAVVPGSTFRYQPGFSRCDSGPREGAANDFSPFLAALVSHATPFLLETAHKKNCEICEFNLGGAMTTLLSDKPLKETFSEMKLMPHGPITDYSPASWMQPMCATEKLGVGACKHTSGPVGWAGHAAADNSCMPCPHECASCTVPPPKKKGDASAKFHCVLRPLLPFPNPTMASLTEELDIFEDAAVAKDSDVFKLPQGYTCSTPSPRKCKGSDWCAEWQFETTCDFPDFK